MTCTKVKDWLDENLTVASSEPPTGIKEHLASCEECREHYAQALALQERLRALETIPLTASEEHRLAVALDERLRLSPPLEIVRPWERWLNLAVRPLVAAAAVLVISLGSMQASSPSGSLTTIVEEVASSNLAENEAWSLLTNGEADYISEALDQASLFYLTQNIPGFQAADLLENMSEDEMRHLVENLSMEL